MSPNVLTQILKFEFVSQIIGSNIEYPTKLHNNRAKEVEINVKSNLNHNIALEKSCAFAGYFYIKQDDYPL